MNIWKKLRNIYRLVLGVLLASPPVLAFSFDEVITVNNDLPTILTLIFFTGAFFYLMNQEEYNTFGSLGLILISFMLLQINLLIGVIIFAIGSMGAFKSRS